MYNPIIRIILAIVGLALAWNNYSNGQITNFYFALFAVGLVIWGYFKNGTVYLAFQQVRKENYEKAEQLLLKINNPNLLKKLQKSYYHFTKGFIELDKENLDSSYDDFTKALELGLRTENDTSILNLNLASIELKRKNLEAAKQYLSQAKSINHKVELDAEIEKLEKKISLF